MILFWPLAGILVATLSWAALYKQLAVERAVADATALKTVAEHAQAEAQRMERSLAMIDQMLNVVKMHWQMLNANIKLENLKDMGSFYDGSTFDIFILDAAGDLRLGTMPASASALLPNLANRQFFIVQKNATREQFFVGYPIRLAPGRPTSINYSRRLLDRDGAFAGVAAITVSANTLVADYDESALGGRGLLEVIGNDNISRAARIGQRHAAFAMVPERLGQLNMETASARFVEGDLFADQRNRYLAWRAVAGYPLCVVVGIDQQDYLALHLERRRASINTAIGASLALALLVLVATYLSARLAWKNHLLQHAHTTYRIATEGGDDGFFIAQVVADGHDAATDFVVVDCNARGAAMFSRARDELIGTALADWRAFIAPEPLLAIVTDAYRAGKAAGELELRDPARGGAAQYLHLRAVRSGRNLALTLQDVSYQHAHMAMLERSSNEDMLTGLPNRAWAQRFLTDLLARAALEQEKIALLFIDLDGFKAVNDGLGHSAGDEVLKHASARLKSAIRPDDHLARLGGDEFIVIVRNVKHGGDAEHVARRVLLSFCEEFATSQGKARLGTSIGISLFPADAHDADTLLSTADVAMYNVKQKGKNNFSFFHPEIGCVLERRRRRGTELSRAIAQDQFVLHYQPRIDIHSGKATSIEALVHWRHPVDGLLGPADFVPLAEETGLILALGELVVDKVCRQVHQWQQAASRPIVPVAVNISGRQFRETNVVKMFGDALRRHRAAASAIEVELHESALSKNPRLVASAVADLRKLGLRIVIDDFSAGCSALSTLHELKFDTVKVAKSYTEMVGKDARSAHFFGALITLAHALGARVVAEGIEEENQLRILQQLQCDEGQGNLLAAATPAPPRQADMIADNAMLALGSTMALQ